MNEKKKYRRLNYLCTTQGINPPFRGDKPFSLQEQLDSFSWFTEKDKNRFNMRIMERIELLKLFIELKFEDKEAFEYWFKLNWEQRKRNMKYREKPVPVRKDNPNTYGEKFVGYGTKRQPRKCRKTAWKRFKKLFPDHKII